MNRPSARVLPTETMALWRLAVGEAVRCLQSGSVVALPTETVYGLAANALDDAAVTKIFWVKDRPAWNPLIVHVENATMAQRCVSLWPPHADQLARAFWPGPLSLVLPAASIVSKLVLAGGSTVGLRCPRHPLIHEVIKACGFPLAAPSANLSNAVSPTRAEHVLKSLGDAVSLIIDGGSCQVGIESTVVDLTVDPVRILRPGCITAQMIAATLEQPVESDVGQASESDGPALSPGRLPKHYAPTARVLVLNWDHSSDLLEQLRIAGVDLKRAFLMVHEQVPAQPDPFGGVTILPHDAEAYARAMYAEWHRCDEWGADCIVVEQVPETPEWKGVSDRLTRASAT